MKRTIIHTVLMLSSLLSNNSCVVSEESAASLEQLCAIAGILVDEQDAQKLETIQSIGEIIITVEKSK